MILSLCLEVLRRKYLQEGGVFQVKNGVGSQFWRGLLNIRKWVILGAKWKIASEGTDCLSFRRSFGPAEITEWEELKKVIDNLETSPVPDTLLWGLATNKKYTTKSMYRTLTFRGIREVNTEM
ncbi:hypothetical protein DAI22_02g171800 [Oryza sativa Japonica Group]|nr:hypothetical protein DAI22_02g171800 [Oryza sativa Japonica Group]